MTDDELRANRYIVHAQCGISMPRGPDRFTLPRTWLSAFSDTDPVVKHSPSHNRTLTWVLGVSVFDDSTALVTTPQTPIKARPLALNVARKNSMSDCEVILQDSMWRKVGNEETMWISHIDEAPICFSTMGCSMADNAIGASGRWWAMVFNTKQPLENYYSIINSFTPIWQSHHLKQKRTHRSSRR